MDVSKSLCAASLSLNVCCFLYWALSKLFLLATKERQKESKRWTCRGFLVGREQTVAKM